MIRRSSRHTSNKSPDEDNPYWVSFSDMMAGLLVVFILALITLMIQQKLKTEELSEAIDQAKITEERANEAESRAKTAEAQAIRAEILAQNAKATAAKAEDSLKIETEKNQSLRQEIVSGIKRLSEIEKIRIEIVTEIATELKRKGVKVIVSENSSAFHIPEETLSFEKAKWDIPEYNKEGVRLIGDILHEAITKKDASSAKSVGKSVLLGTGKE